MDVPLAQTPSNFGLKCCFLANLVPNPICVPHLKLLASTVAEIRRESQILFGCFLGPDPRQFWSKTLFFGKLVPNPSCVPNLKLLDSTVAEIRRGSEIFFGCFPGPGPRPILVLNVVFW